MGTKSQKHMYPGDEETEWNTERGWLSSVHHVRRASGFSGGVTCNVIGQCCDSELWPSAACLPRPTFAGSGRDVNAADQWGRWHSSCQTHSMCISRLFCHQTCVLLPRVNHSETWTARLTRRGGGGEAVMLHKIALIFLVFSLVLRLFFIISD